MSIVRFFAFWLCCLVTAGVVATEPNALPLNIANPDALVPGRDYENIEPPQPSGSGHLEVIEAFSFACPHCNEFEPLLKKWQATLPKDARLARLPVVFGREPWRLLAKAYYASESMGIAEKMSGVIFNALHQQHKKLDTEDALAEVFAGEGVKRDDFLATFRSAAIDKRVKDAETLTGKYKVTGVPTIIVNGKYLTSATLTGDYPSMLHVVEQLLDKERKK